MTVNSSVNFVIYCIFGDKFKRLFCSLFCKPCGVKEDVKHIQRYTTKRGGECIVNERSSTTQVYETTQKTSSTDKINTIANDTTNSRLKTIKEVSKIRTSELNCDTSLFFINYNTQKECIVFVILYREKME